MLANLCTFIWTGHPKTYTEIDFERVVNEPLEGSQSTNHEDADRKSVPQTSKANLAVYSADRLARSLTRLAVVVEFRHHDI